MSNDLHERARALHRVTDAAQKASAARELLETLRAAGPGGRDRVAEALAGAALAEALTSVGELRDAFDCGLRAEEAADAAEHPEARARASLAVAHVLYQVGQLGEAQRRMERVTLLDGAPQELLFRARLNRASTLRAQGRLAEAAAAFDAMQEPREGVGPELRASYLINAASCLHQVNRAPDALDLLDEAHALLRDGDFPFLSAWADAISAWALGAVGRDEEAAASAYRALAPGNPPAVDLRSSAARALAVVALRRPELREAAIEAVEDALVAAERATARRQALDLHGSLDQLYEASGDLVRSVQHLRRALETEEKLQSQSASLRLEREELRIELARLQVEADTLAAGRAELARAHRALVAADAERSRLLRTLAHDLRNPLMSLVASADLVDPDDPESVRGHLRTVEAAGDRMAALLSSALEPATSEPRPLVDAAALARNSASALRGLAARKGQRLVVEGVRQAPLHADPDALVRILDNLVSNALKFGARGSTARVVVLATDTRVDLTVTDEGPGFPDLDPEEGLLLGRQLAVRGTGGEAGWGLGLHTVYQLVAEQGGVLALGNRPEGGGTVRVSLPRS